MALEDIVTVTTVLENGAVAKEGFGTPLVAAYLTWFSDVLVRSYTDPAAMVADGASATAPEVLAVGAALAQTPAPTEVKVGRLTSQPTQRVKVTPTVANTAAYGFTIKAPNGTLTTVSYTSDGSATAAEIIAGMMADLPGGLTGTDQTTYMRVVAGTPGNQYSFYGFTSNLTFEDDTQQAGTLATELSAIRTEDDDWYGLVLASKGTPEITAAATWAESTGKIFCFATQNSDVVGSGSGDIASTLKAGSKFRSIAIFSKDIQEHADAALLGTLLPYDPGSETWKFKTLNGITVSVLSSTQRGYLIAKNCNYYETVKARNITAEGKVCGGEWIDIIRLRDAIDAGLGEDVLGLFVSRPKISLNDTGIAAVEGTVKSTLQGFTGEDLGLGSFTTSVPKAANISATDKGNRILRNVKWRAVMNGAIHATVLNGTLSV